MLTGAHGNPPPAPAVLGDVTPTPMEDVVPANSNSVEADKMDRANKRVRHNAENGVGLRGGAMVEKDPREFETTLSFGSNGAPASNTISREVYMLTGGQTPASLMPTIPIVPSKSAKPRVRTAWKFGPFSNASRSDELKLSHWTRVGTPDEYPFARFNRKILLVSYTDSEYAQVVANNPSVLPAVPAASPRPTDGRSSPRLAEIFASRQLKAPTTSPNRASTASLPPNVSSLTTPVITPPTGGSLRHGIYQVPVQRPWTKDETDALFALCAEYDLRFPVIHDRWPDKFSDRSIDELKDRYYSVSKVVIEHRLANKSEIQKNSSVAFQKHCQAISMNPFDFEYECIRKNQLEWQYSRSKAELREEEETVREARRIEANRNRVMKERKRLAKLLAPATELGSAKNAEQALAAAANLTPQKTFPHRKVSTGPFARSSLVYASVSQSTKVCKRVDAALSELGVDLRPMPTCTVVDNFDLLRMDILNFLELQRTVAKKEEEVHALRVKLAKAKGEPVPSPPPGVPLSHKKRRSDDVDTGSIFGGPTVKKSVQKNPRM